MTPGPSATFPVEFYAQSRPHLTPTSPGTKLRVARLLPSAHYVDTQIRSALIAIDYGGASKKLAIVFDAAGIFTTAADVGTAEPLS